jgi:HIRAN domain
MSVLRRLFNLSPKPEQPKSYARASIVEPRLSVVGESNYQPALLAITGSSPGQDVAHDCIAELVPEPTNPHDPNAIMVRVEGRCVGYLSRQNAVKFGPRINAMIDAGQPTICNAFIGCKPDTGNPNLGVSLEVVL